MSSKTLVKDAARNILRRKIAFLSMLFTVVVGFTGILCTFSLSLSFSRGATDFYRETSFRDLEIVSRVSLTDGNVSEIAALEGVTDAEGLYSADAMMQAGQSVTAVTLLSLTERINVPVLKAGRFPEQANECALDRAVAERLNISVGDTVHLRLRSKSLDGFLRGDSYIVTGLAVHPQDINLNTSALVILPKSAFDPSPVLNGFTSVLAVLDLPEKTNLFSDAYTARVEEVREAIRPEIRKLTDARVEDIRTGFQAYAAFIKTVPAGAMEKLNAVSSEFLLQDCRINTSYSQIRSTIETISTMGYFFSPIFAVVVVIVFFSTIAIIIDDQKKQVGTLKALGFRSGKVRVKYLVFGVSAAVIGGILGILLSVLLEKPVLGIYENKYAFGHLQPSVAPVHTAVFCAGILLITVTVVCAACRNLLHCSSIGLLNGSEPKKRAMIRNRKKDRKTSLYTSLILNNIRTDRARILVSIAIIACSGLLIGSGITLRESFRKSFEAQTDGIGKYDLKINICESMPDDARQALESVLSEAGARFSTAFYGGTIFESASGSYGAGLFCMEADRIADYFNLGTGAAEGVSVSRGLARAYGLDPGTPFTLFGRTLKTAGTEVSDSFVFYIGSMITLPKEEYLSLFGEECGDNCYFVLFGETGGDPLMERLKDPEALFAGYIETETPEEQAGSVESMKTLFNLIAVIFIVLAAVLDFLILINLTNILVSRRMTELLIMRVNGFSMGQAIGYLIRETLFTTLTGLALGVIAGIPFSRLLVRAMGSSSMTLYDTVFPLAWILSVVLGAFFAAAINAICFRKVRKAKLTSIME